MNTINLNEVPYDYRIPTEKEIIDFEIKEHTYNKEEHVKWIIINTENIKGICSERGLFNAVGKLSQKAFHFKWSITNDNVCIGSVYSDNKNTMLLIKR